MYYFTGEATTSIDCLYHGSPGQSTTLVCTITGTVYSGIYWFRPNGGSPQQVVSCNSANTRCISVGGVTGYSAVINSPTQITLTIESFNTALDAGQWMCQDGANGVPAKCDKKTASTLTVQ